MARLLTLTFAALATVLALLAWKAGVRIPERTAERSSSAPPAAEGVRRPLYPLEPQAATPVRLPAPAEVDAIVIAHCPITVINKQDVPSQCEGVIRVIGTEVDPTRPVTGEAVPVRVGEEMRTLRRLKEDDVVQAGQLLACLDDHLSRDEREIKKSRVSASRAELNSATRSAEELRTRYETQLRLRESGSATSDEEVRGAKLASDRAVFEAIARREEVALAERELSQAETTLRMHEIRAAIPGIVKAIYRRPGEAVKRMEPVVQIQDHSRLRAEGLLDVQYVRRLAVGNRVSIEPLRAEAPRESYLGHIGEVTGVAACPSFDAVLVSSSADGTVRVWNRKTHAEMKAFRHASAVPCVSCAPPGSRCSLFVCGAADGTAHIGNLAQLDVGLRPVQGKHEGAVTTCAISNDGKTCATGGEDRDVCLWNTADGSLRYRLPGIHHGGVTFVAFTRRAQMVTVSRDNALRLWSLGESSARLEATFEQRSGDVPRLDVSTDGGRVLYDQGGVLHVLSLPSGTTESVLRSHSGGFQPFALFSPSGRLVLTAEGSDGHLCLWLVPTTGRAREVCQLVAPGCVPTSAAFSPDGTSILVGTRDCQVLVWPVPPEVELEQVIPGELTRVDHAVGPGGKQVRVWAEFLNPNGIFLPGGTATIVVHPGGR